MRVSSSLPLQIQGKIASIEEKGDRKVTRFSITGYSLGGLLARYVIGALYATKFFDTIKPVNFTTIATPHLGIPKYPSFLSAMVRHFFVLPFIFVFRYKFELLILRPCPCRAHGLGQGYLGGRACNSTAPTNPMVRIHDHSWRSWQIIVSASVLKLASITWANTTFARFSILFCTSVIPQRNYLR